MCRENDSKQITLEDVENGQEQEERKDINSNIELKGSGSKEKQAIFVYICGAVGNPDVYEVPEGTRIIDILQLAGGSKKNADLEGINLAKKVRDEEYIYIPLEGEQAPRSVVGGDLLININEADVQDLMELPGIGEVKAKSIIEYREEYQGFSCIEDIMNVNGIGPKIFEKMKDQIEI